MNEHQAQELLTAAVKWQEQGARSKWKSEVSIELWDTIERIKKEREETPNIPAEKLVNILLSKLWHFLLREWGWASVV